jgi:putative redox protein
MSDLTNLDMEQIKGGIPPQVKVTIGKEKYRTVVHANKHGIIVDEPKSMGGANFGMDPFALLLGSLGACTAITIKMYADRKGWALNSTVIELSLKREKINGEDKGEITTSLSFFGDLSEAERNRLLEIASACPVHRTLTGQISIIHKEVSS